MKKLLTFIVSMFLLVGCSGGNTEDTTTKEEVKGVPFAEAYANAGELDPVLEYMGEISMPDIEVQGEINKDLLYFVGYFLENYDGDTKGLPIKRMSKEEVKDWLYFEPEDTFTVAGIFDENDKDFLFAFIDLGAEGTEEDKFNRMTSIFYNPDITLPPSEHWKKTDSVYLSGEGGPRFAFVGYFPNSEEGIAVLNNIVDKFNMQYREDMIMQENEARFTEEINSLSDEDIDMLYDVYGATYPNSEFESERLYWSILEARYNEIHSQE